MVILIVDNDKESLGNLENFIGECRGDVKIVSFTDSVLAMEYIREHEVDILFTEVRMREINGFALTRCIKDKSPNTYVVFVTESAKYAMNAWEAHVNGYLLKPVDMIKIETELDYAVLK